MADEAEKFEAAAEGPEKAANITAGPSGEQILADRISKLEGDVANLNSFIKRANNAVTDYANDLSAETRKLGCIRWIALSAAALYIIFANALLCCIIFYHKIYYMFFHSYAQAAFFIIIIASSILLLLAVLRGAFRGYADRHKENKDFEEIKTLAGIAGNTEIAKTIIAHVK